ncbi:MAG TPA: nucleoside hydrolase [Pirellulales bacterium]|nr:nucleoside hydrolase [Pirellulales bacterium]
MMRTFGRISLLFVAACSALSMIAAARAAERARPIPVIFDTDIGNDIDDALALGVIHALASRGECRLAAVTISKDNPLCAPFIDLVNTFYGRGDIPIGVVRDGKTPEDGNYLRGPVEARDGDQVRFPHKLQSGRDAPEAVALLRQTLAKELDGSVVMIVVGFSTNIARLLDSPGDQVSPLSGKELVAKKCRLLSIMAGNFGAMPVPEYNVHVDVPAARKVYAEWPTEIVASGFEIGLAIKYPAVSIERDFAYVPHHPLSEAYALYMKMPYDRETWDLTSVLYAVRPDRGYFTLSEPGTITVDEKNISRFAPSAAGKHRFLKVDAEQIARVREALVILASQPPDTCAKPASAK